MRNFVLKKKKVQSFIDEIFPFFSKKIEKCIRRKLKFLIELELFNISRFAFRDREIFRSRCKIEPDPRTESRNRVYQRGFRLATTGTAACHGVGDETS